MNGLKFITLPFLMHLIIISGIPVAQDSLGQREREPVIIDDNVVTCSRNMECGWLICVWAREYNEEYGCQFFHNQCDCPSHLECNRVAMSAPSESHLIWDYRCQEPESNKK
ncbi:uncharacterized protein LOC111099129 isoform X2 [Crassostrea virginica]